MEKKGKKGIKDYSISLNSIYLRYASSFFHIKCRFSIIAASLGSFGKIYMQQIQTININTITYSMIVKNSSFFNAHSSYFCFGFFFSFGSTGV
jgi:hypothetical protein